MPLHDGNNKILDSLTIAGALNGTSGIKLGDVDVVQVRLGGTAIFPDTVGAPVIETFTSPYDAMNLIARTGGTATLSITGIEGATFSVSISIADIDDATGTIPASGSTTVSFAIPGTTSGGAVNHTATISATGVSILDPALVPTVTITQEAATPHGITSDFTPVPTFVGVNLGFISPSSLPLFAFTITVTRTGGFSGWDIAGFSNQGGNNITVSPTTSSATSQAVQVTVVGGGGTGNEGGVRITRAGFTTYQQEVIEWGIG